VSPAQRHGLELAAAASPLVAYQVREVSRGAEGWPISRFLRLLPVWLFLLLGGLFLRWFVPHIVKRARR
jgi:hypothetical protein